MSATGRLEQRLRFCFRLQEAIRDKVSRERVGKELEGMLAAKTLDAQPEGTVLGGFRTRDAPIGPFVGVAMTHGTSTRVLFQWL